MLPLMPHSCFSCATFAQLYSAFGLARHDALARLRGVVLDGEPAHGLASGEGGAQGDD